MNRQNIAMICYPFISVPKCELSSHLSARRVPLWYHFVTAQGSDLQSLLVRYPNLYWAELTRIKILTGTPKLTRIRLIRI